MSIAPTTERQAFGLAAWSGQSKGMAGPHRHNELELNYVCDGSMTYLVGGSLVTLPRRRLCVLWGAAPHQTVRTSEGTHVIWVTVPLPQVLGWKLSERFMRQLLGSGLAIDPQPRPADEPTLLQWITDLRRGRDASARRIVLLEIEARLRRLDHAFIRTRTSTSHTSPTAPSDPDGPLPPLTGMDSAGLETIQRMTRFIVEHYTEPIYTHDIARAGHVHPNYAMHLFRKHLQTTIHQYLTRQRIAHAQRLLATTNQPVLEIALESGFNSLSRFFEMFKKHAGCTPRQFRANLLHGQTP